MIFLTLGTQLPFDRLVKAVDQAAASISEPIVGQIGEGAYTPSNFDASAFLRPEEYDRTFANARVIIGHAGIGTILGGLNSRKTMILMSRRKAHGEHRNDHQWATAKQVQLIDGIFIVETAAEIQELLKNKDIEAPGDTRSESKFRLISKLEKEIASI